MIPDTTDESDTVTYNTNIISKNVIIILIARNVKVIYYIQHHVIVILGSNSNILYYKLIDRDLLYYSVA